MRMGLAILNHGLDYARLVGLTYHNRTSYNAAFNSLSPFLLHMVTKSFKKLGDFVLILVNLVFGSKTHDFISLTLQKTMMT